MAEERLIDDDKDRKYKIRKNADGEDELIIETPSEEEEPVFEVPEFDSDDDEASCLTPEQYAERLRKRDEEAARRRKSADERIVRANECLAENDFDGALYNLDEAETSCAGNGGIYLIKLTALTKNFSDFSRIDECVAAAEKLAEYGSEDEKNSAALYAETFKTRADSLRPEVETLGEENELKKSERREVFGYELKRSRLHFITSAVQFVLFLAVTLFFASTMYSRSDGLYMILTFVFAGIAVLALAGFALSARKFLKSLRNLKLNESDSSTKLGREYKSLCRQISQSERVYELIKKDL